MTKQEKLWYTRGRVDQLGRKPFADMRHVSKPSQALYEAGADSVTADEQDLYAETLREIAECESFAAYHVSNPEIAAELEEARRRLLALHEPMPVLVEEVVNA